MKFDWMTEKQCLVDAVSTIEWNHPRVKAKDLEHAKRLALECVKYNKMIHISTNHLGQKANIEFREWLEVTCHKETEKLIEDWKI